eukprot:scaffold32295_cov74-Phaeocystis_antarctica.AAC.1
MQCNACSALLNACGALLMAGGDVRAPRRCGRGRRYRLGLPARRAPRLKPVWLARRALQGARQKDHRAAQEQPLPHPRARRLAARRRARAGAA